MHIMCFTQCLANTKCLLFLVSCHSHHHYQLYHLYWDPEQPVYITETRRGEKRLTEPPPLLRPSSSLFLSPRCIFVLGFLGPLHYPYGACLSYLSLFSFLPVICNRNNLNVLFPTKKRCAKHPMPFQIFYLF